MHTSLAELFRIQKKHVAAYGIASLIGKEELRAEYIIPKAFDPRVAETVAKAVYESAVREGVARIKE